MGKRIELTEVYRPKKFRARQERIVQEPVCVAISQEELAAALTEETAVKSAELPAALPESVQVKRQTVKGLVEVGLISPALLKKLEGMGLELVVRDIAKHRARQAAYRSRKGG